MSTHESERGIERLVYREARLLDEGRLDEWLTLWTDDGVYWMPMNGVQDDPATDPSVLFDTTADRAQRVHQLQQTPHYAQIPASRTIRQLTNLEIDVEPAPGGEVERAAVHGVLNVHEVRPGDPGQRGIGRARCLPGRVRYLLRHEAGRWQIAEKRVHLLARDLPLWNLSFVY